MSKSEDKSDCRERSEICREKYESVEKDELQENSADTPSYMYIVRCRDDSLYTGWTNHLEERIAAHNAGKGAKYTKSRRPVELVYYEVFGTKKEAMSREFHVKRLTRSEKLKLISEELRIQK